MFSFSVQEIDLYVGLDKDVLNAMASIEDSIASSIAASVIAYNGASVDVDTIASTEHAIATEQAFLNNDLFQDMLEECSSDMVKVMDLVKWRESAPSEIAILNAELAMLKSAKYDAFQSAWAVTRTRGKQGPRVSYVGKVLEITTQGNTRVIPIVTEQNWTMFSKVNGTYAVLCDESGKEFSSENLADYKIKSGSTAQRLMVCAVAGKTTSRTVNKITTEYSVDGSVESIRKGILDKTFSKISVGGMPEYRVIHENAQEFVKGILS